MERKKGNLLGILAILLMSSLGLLSILTKNIPAFELTALSFISASFVGLILMKKQNVKMSKCQNIKII